MRRGNALALAVVLGVGALAPSRAFADDNDLTLERLIGPPASPGTAPVITPALRSAYAGLVSELGVVLSPRPLQPADSLGWSGFAASLDVSATQVNRSADYWQKGVRDVSGLMLGTIGATFRKGLWLGLPSFEISVGGHKLLDSGMFTLEVAAKLALMEGFHRWPIPSIALRVAVSHAFGTPQLSLTVLETGVLVSKRFPVKGTVQIDPYIGVAALISFATSQLIDTTPDLDAFRQGPMGADQNANVVLPDPDALPRVRLHGGLRLKASLFQLTVEGAYVLCNSTGRDCQRDGSVEVVDRSGGQAQLSVSAGVLY